MTQLDRIEAMLKQLLERDEYQNGMLQRWVNPPAQQDLCPSCKKPRLTQAGNWGINSQYVCMCAIA